MSDDRVAATFVSWCPECGEPVDTIEGRTLPHHCAGSVEKVLTRMPGGAVNDGQAASFSADGTDEVPDESKDQAAATAPAAPPLRPRKYRWGTGYSSDMAGEALRQLLEAEETSTTVPDWVKVGPLVYDVQISPDAVRSTSDDQTPDMDGEWVAFSDHDRLIIGINPDQHPDAVRRDLLHEVLHCCMRVSGAEPNQYARIVARAKGRDGGLTVEEVMVAATTLPLLGVLRDNPELVAWLKEES